MIQEYELVSDPKNGKLKTFPIIECFDKKTEYLLLEFRVHGVEITQLRRWLKETFSWGYDEPLIGAAPLNKELAEKFKKLLNPLSLQPLDFDKYDYHLSFEHESVETGEIL